MIEKILGSSKEITELVERPLTDIEWGVSDRIVDRFMQTMAESMRSGYFSKYGISSRESNPRFISILTATEPVISVSYEFVTAKSKGLISIAIPLEIIYKLVLQMTASAIPHIERRKQVSPKIFENAYFDLTCYFGGYPITVRDLVTIKSGTVLKIENGKANSVTVSIQGRKKFQGQIGEMEKNKRAVKVVDKTSEAREKSFIKIENGDQKEISDVANGVEFTLSVEVANKQIEFSELGTLSEGDVIRFDKSVDSEFRAFINGKPKALGHAVRVGDKFGFQFTTFL
jgi:flagellar motor switch protein FliM